MSVTQIDEQDLKPFLRIFEIPSAAPWDQTRAARLRALHGSPLPAHEVVISVERLDPWRSDGPSRFCAAYAKRSEIPDVVCCSLSVEGRQLAFTFRTDQAGRSPAFGKIVSSALSAAAIVAALAALFKSVELRQANVHSLTAAVDSAERSRRLEQSHAVEARNAALLARAGLSGHAGGDVLNDLEWIAQSKTPLSNIVSLEWRPAAIVVRTRGDAQPFSSQQRTIERIADPSDGVSTWQITGKGHSTVELVHKPHIMSAHSPYNGDVGQ